MQCDPRPPRSSRLLPSRRSSGPRPAGPPNAGQAPACQRLADLARSQSGSGAAKVSAISSIDLDPAAAAAYASIACSGQSREPRHHRRVGPRCGVSRERPATFHCTCPPDRPPCPVLPCKARTKARDGMENQQGIVASSAARISRASAASSCRSWLTLGVRCSRGFVTARLVSRVRRAVITLCTGGGRNSATSRLSRVRRARLRIEERRINSQCGRPAACTATQELHESPDNFACSCRIARRRAGFHRLGRPHCAREMVGWRSATASLKGENVARRRQRPAQGRQRWTTRATIGKAVPSTCTTMDVMGTKGVGAHEAESTGGRNRGRRSLHSYLTMLSKPFRKPMTSATATTTPPRSLGLNPAYPHSRHRIIGFFRGARRKLHGRWRHPTVSWA